MYSGFITWWHTWPQNWTESMYSMPRYDASETMMMLASVSTKTIAAALRCAGSFRSNFGQSPSDVGFPP